MRAWAAETAAGAGEAFYEAPEFWVAVAFVIVVAAIFKPVAGRIGAALDDRAETIKTQIDEAVRLHEEAQELLASYERKHRHAAAEAEEIVERARKEADRLGKRAAEDLEKALKRRQKLAMERIARAEAEALDEVRGVAVDVALDATRRLLAEKMSGKRADVMIDAAIEELPEKLG